MQTELSRRVIRKIFMFCFVAGVIPVSMVAQNRVSIDYRGSYYYQVYDQGFRAGRADFDAGRPYSYHAALVMTAGVASISQDYRSAFKLGYQDGYSSRDRGSDWYYRHHRHDADCDEDDDRGRDNWSCRERHDNGKHRGWYKHAHHKQQGEDEDDDD